MPAAPLRALSSASIVACAALAVLGTSGCPGVDDGLARVQGFLFDDPRPLEDAQAVSGAEVTSWTDDGRELVDGVEPFSDFPGFYRFEDLPKDTAVHLVFTPDDDDDRVATVLSGRVPTDDLFVDPGVFHVWPRPTVDAWVERWRLALLADWRPDPPTFDPAVPDEGGMVVGSVAGAADHLGLRLVFVDSAGVHREAWYTNDKGAATLEGGISEEGTFLRWGLAPGPLEVLVFQPDGSTSGRSFFTRVEEDAVTSLRNFHVL